MENVTIAQYADTEQVQTFGRLQGACHNLNIKEKSLHLVNKCTVVSSLLKLYFFISWQDLNDVLTRKPLVYTNI